MIRRLDKLACQVAWPHRPRSGSRIARLSPSASPRLCGRTFRPDRPPLLHLQYSASLRDQLTCSFPLVAPVGPSSKVSRAASQAAWEPPGYTFCFPILTLRSRAGVEVKPFLSLVVQKILLPSASRRLKAWPFRLRPIRRIRARLQQPAGLRQERPGKRENPLSRETNVAWCSMARAASHASLMSFPVR